MSDFNDIQTVEISSVDAETMEMEFKAKCVAEELTRHYPGFPWIVGWAPGMTLVVKTLIMEGRFGYTIDAAKSFSASDLSRAAMLAGGELLERLGMPRRAWNGDMPTGLDKSGILLPN